MTIFSKNFGGNGPFGPPWLRLWNHMVSQHMIYAKHCLIEQCKISGSLRQLGLPKCALDFVGVLTFDVYNKHVTHKLNDHTSLKS